MIPGKYSDILQRPEWQAKRLEILQRDGYVCQNCGKQFDEPQLNVHHKYYVMMPFVHPWDYPDEDLITLCPNCHKLIHNSNDIKIFPTIAAAKYYIREKECVHEALDEDVMLQKWNEYKTLRQEHLEKEHPNGEWKTYPNKGPYFHGQLMSIPDYRYFRDHSFPIEEIQAYCLSGRTIYEKIKGWTLKESCEHYDFWEENQWQSLPLHIKNNPYRPGFYKIILIDEKIHAFYSAVFTQDFIEEEIPPFNIYPLLRTGLSQDLKQGDIILIKRCILNGDNHYNIEWENLKKGYWIKGEIRNLQEQAYYIERFISDVEYDRAEVRSCIKDKVDFPISDSKIQNLKNEIGGLKEQIKYYEELLEKWKKISSRKHYIYFSHS